MNVRFVPKANIAEWRCKAELFQIDLDQRHDAGIWLRKISAPVSLPKGTGRALVAPDAASASRLVAMT